MKPTTKTQTIDDIRVHPDQLDFSQPLARFLVTLFNLFEDEMISKLAKSPYKEVTRTDLNLLRYIDAGGVTVSQLAKYAGVTKQAVSKQVENLSTRGYVKKHADKDDARVSRIHFTDRGLSLIHLLIKVIREIELRYEQTIGEGEYLKIKKNLRKLIGLYPDL